METQKLFEYMAYKLGRRTDSFHKGAPAVGNGLIFASPATVCVYDFKEEDDKKFVNQKDFIPQIGKSVWIQGRGRNDFVRTSLISDYYIHDEPELSKDKIVLPFQHATMLEGIEWQKGDVLLVTLNSLYYLKKVS